MITHRNFYLIQGSQDEGQTWNDLYNQDGKERYHKVMHYFNAMKESGKFKYFRVINREIRDTVHKVSE